MELSKSIDLIDIIPELRDLPSKTKQWLLDQCELVSFNKGDVAYERGEPIDNMQLIVHGKLQLRLIQNNNWRAAGTFNKGTIAGLLPYSRLQSANGSTVALEDTTILTLHKSSFPILIRDHQELTEVLVHSMTSRVRESTKNQQQNEKLMALGKLSAGLAHELNNPASAIVRSSELLKKHLSSVPEKFKRIMEISANDRQVDLVNELIFKKIDSEKPQLKLIEKTEKEDEITDYLEAKDCTEDAFENAQLFVEHGFDKDDFEYLYKSLNPKDFPAVINWIAQVLTTDKMVDEIEIASSRIANLVKSIKSYTHMDKSQEKVLIDPIIGITDTLTILNHKIKKKNIKKKVNKHENVTPIKALPSELNQVWMNLIDNAIDAMANEGGLLDIDLLKENDFLKISFTDNGEGIDDTIISNIFDPFFTTKKIGEGTGLGLDVAKRIINGHNGSLSAQSTKGRTTFEVCLPY